MTSTTPRAAAREPTAVAGLRRVSRMYSPRIRAVTWQQRTRARSVGHKRTRSRGRGGLCCVPHGPTWSCTSFGGVLTRLDLPTRTPRGSTASLERRPQPHHANGCGCWGSATVREDPVPFTAGASARGVSADAAGSARTEAGRLISSARVIAAACTHGIVHWGVGRRHGRSNSPHDRQTHLRKGLLLLLGPGRAVVVVVVGDAAPAVVLQQYECCV